MFGNKRKMLKLKVKLAGLQAELDEWRRLEQTTQWCWPGTISDLARKVAQTEAEIKERSAYV